MDWTGSNLRSFVSRPDSLNLLYNYNGYDPFPGMEMMSNKHPGGGGGEIMASVPQYVMGPSSLLDKTMSYGNQEKKKRLTNDQLESLENSFLEEIKLDPDRKMKLARELGLQPRQVAVWFQNRRARWKAKQLERLYDSLKQEFDAVSREKQKLQEEVLKLRAMVMEQATKNQVSNGYTEISAEETVESTSVALHSSGKQPQDTSPPPQNGATECHYLFNVDEYNTVSPPYWGALPSYP